MPGSSVSSPSLLQMLLGLYGYLLPVLLYVLWSTLALWDIGRRTELSAGKVWVWVLAIFLLPFVGPVAYLLLAGKSVPQRSRVVLIGGGAAAYVLVLVAAALSGAN